MSQSDHHSPAGHTPAQSAGHSQPPIEWPVSPAQSTAKTADHHQAAEFARQRVDQAYQQTPTPTTQPQQQISHHTMRDEPYDWHKYHAAWQQYYHQYFYRYYANWWQQQKLQQAPATSTDAPDPKSQVASELRQKVRHHVTKRAKRVRSSSHFKPIVAAVTVGVSFLLINYNQVLVGAIKQYVAPGSVVTTPVIVEPSSAASVGSDPKIIIPKIGVEAPVVYDEQRVDEPSYQAALERGVVRLGTTANPGTKGNIVIGGHSSNNVFNAGGYKYVFVNLRRLEGGDIIYLNYGGQRYTYKVTVKKVIPPSDTSALAPTSTPLLTLFTCDPPGTNINRLIIQAEQIDPDPAQATANQQQSSQTNSTNPLPSVAPSLWDRLFN